MANVAVISATDFLTDQKIKEASATASIRSAWILKKDNLSLPKAVETHLAMTKKEAINKTLIALDKLPLEKIQEVSDFADFILKKLEDETINLGIRHLIEKGQPYEFLKEEEDIYTVEDLK